MVCQFQKKNSLSEVLVTYMGIALRFISDQVYAALASSSFTGVIFSLFHLTAK